MTRAIENKLRRTAQGRRELDHVRCGDGAKRATGIRPEQRPPRVAVEDRFRTMVHAVSPLLSLGPESGSGLGTVE